MPLKDWGETLEEIKKNLDKANLEFLKQTAATQKDHEKIAKEVKEIKTKK